VRWTQLPRCLLPLATALTLTTACGDDGPTRVAPSIAIAIAPASLSLGPGEGKAAVVAITRAGGFAGAVALSASGAPEGVEVTAAPASTTESNATLTVRASATAVAGTDTITVTATAPDVEGRSATLTVAVAPTQGTGTSVSFSYCATDAPLWVAAQDGTGAWTRLTPGPDNAYAFDFASGRGGLATVRQDATGSVDLAVTYATPAQFSAQANSIAAACDASSELKTVNGSVQPASLALTDFVTVSLGPASVGLGADAGNTFQIQQVPGGAHDLIALRATRKGIGTAVDFVPNTLIIRRGVNVANGGTLAPLDFDGPEAFESATANVTIDGLGADLTTTSDAFAGTSSGDRWHTTLYSGPLSAGATRRYFGIPAARLVAGELNVLWVSTRPSTGPTDRSRFAYQFFTTVTDRTVSLGPDLAAPTITAASTAPYLRLRAQLTAQAEYDQYASATFVQDARSASTTMTGAYAGGAAYDLEVPDLSGVQGFDPAWGLVANVTTTWNVVAGGGPSLLDPLGPRPTDGTTAFLATRFGHAPRAPTVVRRPLVRP